MISVTPTSGQPNIKLDSATSPPAYEKHKNLWSMSMRKTASGRMNETPALVTVTPTRIRIRLATNPAITPSRTEVRRRESGDSTA
jgi:hypothetical protein